MFVKYLSQVKPEHEYMDKFKNAVKNSYNDAVAETKKSQQRLKKVAPRGVTKKHIINLP